MLAVYWVLHQDTWNWRASAPFAFGFLPIGLTYHALYTLGVSAIMWLLVKYAWPEELERDLDGSGD